MRRTPFNFTETATETMEEPENKATEQPQPAPPAEQPKAPEPPKIETKINWTVVILAVVVTAVVVYFFMKTRISTGA